MQAEAVCDIIIPVWDQLNFTRDCLKSILDYTCYPYRLIIIDNGSHLETKEYLENFKKENDSTILIRNEENMGFVKAANQGLKASSANYVCLLNNDTKVTKNWLTNLVEILQNNPRIGIINPTWQEIKGKTPEECAEILSKNRGKYLEVNECMGFCMLVKREVIERIGYLDEVFGIGGKEDSDYCRRAVLANFRCARAKDAFVFHRENTSFDQIEDWRKDRQIKQTIFEQRWGRRKQIVFIWDEKLFLNEKEFIEKLKFCLSLARVGVKVHIWIILDRRSNIENKDYLYSKGIPEHNNIKYFYFIRSNLPVLKNLKKCIFDLACLIKLVSRRNKNEANKYKAVFVPDRKMGRFLTNWRFLHNVRVFEKVENCTLIQQELEWARSICE